MARRTNKSRSMRVDESLFRKVENFRKMAEKRGIKLAQKEITRIMASRIKSPGLPELLKNKRNNEVRKKKRRS